MGNISAEILLLILSAVVIVSYLFSIVSRVIKIPSVLLLLAAGIILRVVADEQQWDFVLPSKLVEFLGITGLVMNHRFGDAAWPQGDSADAGRSSHSAMASSLAPAAP